MSATRRITSKVLSRLGLGALATSACMLLLPAAASALAPPTLSVSLDRLPAGAGYLATAHLSAPWSYDCHAVNADPPDLAWSQNSKQLPKADAFTASLANWAGDARALTCNATTWHTTAALPFGGKLGIQAPGKWYFQVELSCPTDGSDADCAETGLTYTNIVAVTIPQPGSDVGSAGAKCLPRKHGHRRSCRAGRNSAAG